jgi:hypothetical protein
MPEPRRRSGPGDLAASRAARAARTHGPPPLTAISTGSLFAGCPATGPTRTPELRSLRADHSRVQALAGLDLILSNPQVSLSCGPLTEVR